MDASGIKSCCRHADSKQAGFRQSREAASRLTLMSMVKCLLAHSCPGPCRGHSRDIVVVYKWQYDR